MKKTLAWIAVGLAISILAIALTLGGHSREQVLIKLLMLVPDAPSTVSARYVEPSATTVLAPGEKIKALFKKNISESYVLQRLGDQTYWFQARFYGALFLVGDDGVLAFDPPEHHGKEMLAAIRAVTDKPITTVVYSYYHADHIAGAKIFIEENRAAGITTKIVSSSATAAKMARLESTLPRPTETIPWPRGQFKFENTVIELHGFEHAAHTSDHGIWYIPSEKIAHVPDLINPDQPPFTGFADAETFVEYESNINQLDNLDWVYLSGGHGNVGAKADVVFHKTYVSDLKQAVHTAIEQTPVGAGINPLSVLNINSHTPIYTAWLEEIAKRAADIMRPKYGQYYGFEAGMARNAMLITLTYNGFK
jgi:glyoxylase-like metal-dependent hydrolase (beta-lactamase superfamily II)